MTLGTHSLNRAGRPRNPHTVRNKLLGSLNWASLSFLLLGVMHTGSHRIFLETNTVLLCLCDYEMLKNGTGSW